jgi:uncharacterized protein
MKKVLSFCGGGSSGYITASLLTKIEEELGPVMDKVDMIAGVSTGSIIGSLMLSGHSSKEIKTIYREFFGQVFGKKRNYLVALFKSFYDTNKLKSALDSKLSGLVMKDCEVDFMVHALQLNEPELSTKFWKSWDERDADVALSDVVCASSSALTAFPPYQIGDNYYQDGGIFMNDPSLVAYSEMKRRGFKKIKVLDFQTDRHTGFKDAKKIKGLVKIVPKIAPMAIDGGERAIEYMCRQIIGKDYLCVNPEVYLPIDSSNWDEMDRAVERVWEAQKDQIINFFKS